MEAKGPEMEARQIIIVKQYYIASSVSMNRFSATVSNILKGEACRRFTLYPAYLRRKVHLWQIARPVQKGKDQPRTEEAAEDESAGSCE